MPSVIHYFIATLVTLILAAVAVRWAELVARRLSAAPITASATAVAFAVAAIVFVGTGTGWRWPGLTRGGAAPFELLGGLAIGCAFALFLWLLSRRMQCVWFVLLLITNATLAVPMGAYDVVRNGLFVLANFVIVNRWLHPSV
jgi:hypothetical protein